MRYTEWVDVVLKAAIAGVDSPYGPSQLGYSVVQFGTALGVDTRHWNDDEGRAFHLAISDAVDDLDDLHLLASKVISHLAAVPEARRYRTHPLRELWPKLRAGHLEPDEEGYLGKLSELSEVPHDGWAEVRRLASSEVFRALGWDWDRHRSLRIVGALAQGLFAHARSTTDMDTVRLRLAGAVRVSDEVGASLAEARDHLTVGRVRAAGCVAGIQLERRLKDLCLTRSISVSDRLPSLADYNQALKRARVYPQATWRKIDLLSDLRNRCAHVLDVEPTEADARELVDGVDAVLRAFPG